MMTAAVSVDLTEVADGLDLQRMDRHRLDVLNRVPDGAHVIVDIGQRRWISQDAAIWLHEHEHRLRITIVGHDPDAVAAFLAAARAGTWEVA